MKNTLGDKAQLVLSVAGLLLFFLVYGVIQEKIMTTAYGEGKEMFKYTPVLVLANRLVSIIVSVFILFTTAVKDSRVSQQYSMLLQKEHNSSSAFFKRFLKSITPVAPLAYYGLVSISNFMATMCQYEALKYISFPTQTLGKCGKIVPVLVVGRLWYGKKYTSREYLVALLITAGCFMFLVSGDYTSSAIKSSNDSPIGLLLISVYLLCDGLTSTTQERLFKNYKMSTHNQMLYVNMFSALLSVFALAFGSFDRVLEAMVFIKRHPAILSDMLVLSLSSTLGQLLIYYIIKKYGAFLYSTVMTTRQFFGLFLSCIIFKHSFTSGQLLGAVAVFAGMYLKIFASNGGTKHKSGNVNSASSNGDVSGSKNSKLFHKSSPVLPLTSIKVSASKDAINNDGN
ncbi:hypothetical protein MP228_003028 [Amoeboaphelidium protococcarum]|nr:hypothetical protein MP228_003028 [Amoeboaphelidium protococcarum]